MNENEQNFSSAPYRATKNLNTVIGNPDININSAMTSNILDSETSLNNQSNQTNLFVDSEISSFSSDTFNNDQLDSNQTLNNNVVANIDNNISNDNFDSFKFQEKEVVSEQSNLNVDMQNDLSSNLTNKFIQADNNFSSNFSSNNEVFNGDGVDGASSVNSSYVQNTNVRNNSSISYENVYKSEKKKEVNTGSISIPQEFKTAIFVVLILLVVISCFEPIYDFFRNLHFFG